MAKTYIKSAKKLKPKEKDLPYKRLAFLREYMASQGISVKDAGEVCGMTGPAISAAFKADDMKISNVIKIIESAGFVLNIFLTTDSTVLLFPERRPNFDAVFYNNKKLDRLAFLYYFLNIQKISIPALAEKIGAGQATIYYAFQQDNILMSRLYQIAEVLGCSLLISVNKKEDAKREDDSNILKKGPNIVIELNHRSVTPF